MVAVGFGERADGEIDVQQYVLEATRKPVSCARVTCRVGLKGTVAGDARFRWMLCNTLSVFLVYTLPLMLAFDEEI
jgi:hypothetical protein